MRADSLACRVRSTLKGTLFVLLALTLTGCDTTFGRIALRNMGVAFRRPDPAPVRIVDPIRRDARLAVLWVGHATALIQIDDRLVLTDPVFTEFVGGLSHRLVEPGIAPENLPNVDVVLVSHRGHQPASFRKRQLTQRSIGR